MSMVRRLLPSQQPLIHLPLHVFFFFPFPVLFLPSPEPVGVSQWGKRETVEPPCFLEPALSLPERLKSRGVRFGDEDEAEEWGEPQVKDSGVDTCSSTTLNEEHGEKVPAGPESRSL